MSSATQLYNQTVKFGSMITETTPITTLTSKTTIINQLIYNWCA